MDQTLESNKHPLPIIDILIKEINQKLNPIGEVVISRYEKSYKSTILIGFDVKLKDNDFFGTNVYYLTNNFFKLIKSTVWEILNVKVNFNNTGNFFFIFYVENNKD